MKTHYLGSNFSREGFSQEIMNNPTMNQIHFAPDETFERRVLGIMLFTKMVEALEILGWVEHTSDWDPYLEITMKDGSIIRSLTGCTEIYFIQKKTHKIIHPDIYKLEIPLEYKIETELEDYITIGDTLEDVGMGDEFILKRVPITQIQSIQITR